MKQPEAVVLASEGRRFGLCPARRRAGRRTSGRFAYRGASHTSGQRERPAELSGVECGMQGGSALAVGMCGAGAERESRSASASLGPLLLSQEGPARRKSGRHIRNR